VAQGDRPTFQPHADPDPDPSFLIEVKPFKRARVGSYSTDPDPQYGAFYKFLGKNCSSPTNIIAKLIQNTEQRLMTGDAHAHCAGGAR
jgi:hypothetical protein